MSAGMAAGFKEGASHRARLKFRGERTDTFPGTRSDLSSSPSRVSFEGQRRGQKDGREKARDPDPATQGGGMRSPTKWHIRLLSTLTGATLLPNHTLAQDASMASLENPHTLPAAPRPIVVSRSRVDFETHPSREGDTLVVAATTYEDGTVVTALAAVWVKAPLPLEIIVLDDFVPAPRVVDAPIARADGSLPLPSGRRYEAFSVLTRRPTESAEDTVQGPQRGAPRASRSGTQNVSVEILSTPRSVAVDTLLDVPQAQSELGSCPEGTLRGLARIQAEGFPAMLPGLEKSFHIGNLVCIRVVNRTSP